MRYVSIDLETTGLDHRVDQVLQVALVVEDTAQPDVPVEELPYFLCCLDHDRFQGAAYALGLNADLLSAIARTEKQPDGERYVEVRGRRQPVYLAYPSWGTTGGMTTQPEWVQVALRFLQEHFGSARATAAGKNAAGFDLPFLPDELRERFLHRVLDPGSLCADLSPGAQQLPSLQDLKVRFGLGDVVAHDALDDARDVIRVIRAAWGAS